MDQSPSVGDVMRREYVGLNEGDTVAGAAELMHEEGVDGALVVRGSDPIGILTASDVMAVVAGGDDPATIAVDAVMRQPVVTVGPDADLTEAVGAMADRGVGCLAVVSQGDLLGMLAEHDLVTAPIILSPVGSGATPDPTESAVGEPERRDVGLRSATYTTQGVCELCGALSRSLDPHNGQLVCEDCRAM